MEINADVLKYRSTVSSTHQVIFDQLAAIAHQIAPDMQNAIKWRVPTFTLNGNWHHWLFSISQTKKGVTLNFHKGWLLADPEQVLQGDGKHLRQLVFTLPEQVREEVVANLMREAIRHQTEVE